MEDVSLQFETSFNDILLIKTNNQKKKFSVANLSINGVEVSFLIEYFSVKREDSETTF